MNAALIQILRPASTRMPPSHTPTASNAHRLKGVNIFKVLKQHPSNAIKIKLAPKSKVPSPADLPRKTEESRKQYFTHNMNAIHALRNLVIASEMERQLSYFSVIHHPLVILLHITSYARAIPLQYGFQTFYNRTPTTPTTSSRAFRSIVTSTCLVHFKQLY